MNKKELEKLDRVSKIFNFSSIYDDNGVIEQEMVESAKDFIKKYNPSDKFLEAAEKLNDLGFEWARIKDESLKKYIPNRSLNKYDSPHLFYFEDSSLTEDDCFTPSINKINGETFDDCEKMFSINIKDITCLTYEDIKFFEKNDDTRASKTYKTKFLTEADMPIVENYIKELTKLEKTLEKNKKKDVKNIGD